MGNYLVTIANPRFLTSEEEITLGAKNLLGVLRIIMHYRRKYVTFTIKVM